MQSVFSDVVARVANSAQLPYKTLIKNQYEQPQKIIPPIKGDFNTS